MTSRSYSPSARRCNLGAERGHRFVPERPPVRFRRGLVVVVDAPSEPRRRSDHEPGEPEAGREHGADDGEGFGVHGPEPGALAR